MNIYKNEYVSIPTMWLSDYDLFPKRLMSGEVVLCTKNPYHFAETIYKIVPVNYEKNELQKEALTDENT